jgi:hypothetical protein
VCLLGASFPVLVALLWLGEQVRGRRRVRVLAGSY